jgi:seryl-tRNA synthetase
MKWGVRRGRYSKAYGKAVRKRQKLEDRSAKLQVKANKKLLKSSKKMLKATSSGKMMKALKLQAKGNKLALKSSKLKNKALKWQKKMDKVFAGYDIKTIPKKTIKSGKDFIDILRNGNYGYEVTNRA